MIAFLPILWGFISKGFGAVVSFCSKPPGSYLAITLACFIAVKLYGWHEFNRGLSTCQAAHAQANAKEALRQTSAISAVNTASNVRTSQSTTIKQANEKVIVHVKDQAEIMPGASEECITPDIADGLRSVR